MRRFVAVAAVAVVVVRFVVVVAAAVVCRGEGGEGGGVVVRARGVNVTDGENANGCSLLSVAPPLFSIGFSVGGVMTLEAVVV